MNLNYFYFSSQLINQALGIYRVALPRIQAATVADGKVKQNPIVIDCIPRPAPLVPSELIEIIIFSVMDSIIDMRYSGLANESFSQRYKALPKDKELQIIFKECYRAIKLIRNAKVHDRTSVQNNPNNYEVKMSWRGKSFEISCSFESLRHLLNLCLLFIENIDVEDAYFVLIMRHYYHCFLNGVICFQDEISNSLTKISRDEKFYPYFRFRYQMKFSDLKQSDGSFSIKRQQKIYKIYIEEEKKEIEYDNCDEYLIENEGVAKYLIPGHKVGMNGEISIDQLMEWEVGAKHL